MSDAGRMALRLMEDTFACPAAILVAFVDDPDLVVLHNDLRHVSTLERDGCIANGQVTSFGHGVAMVLRSRHGVQAWSQGRVS